MEHLKELRYRLMVSAIGVVLGLAVSAYFGQDLIDFLKRPAEERSSNFHLQFIEPFELFVTYFRVSLLGGLVLGMPVIVYQALRFVSPALKPGERRWLYGTVVGATALFLTGVAFAYYVALPPALDFLLNFGTDLAQPNIRVGSYIDFVTRLLFWTGVAFETPLVVMYLARLGIVRAGQLVGWWRIAIVGAFVVAAVVTPTIDPVTQSLVAGPIIVLYFLGIVLAVIVQPKRPQA
ncbi:MAG: twin-arginine translocase subunit TatC [Dehalococcoidia bacterium]|nr:twin-arginine translocase subunit TatC [Dehalococcoidia bacterium]